MTAPKFAAYIVVKDMVLASSARPLPADERDYVRAVREAGSAVAKLTTYAAALARLMPTLSPLLLALRDAGLTDPECAASWEHVVERRATNMLVLAGELRATGSVREDLDDQRVADLIWSTDNPEWFAAFTSRGRSTDDYAATLADLWARTLLVRGSVRTAVARRRHRRRRPPTGRPRPGACGRCGRRRSHPPASRPRAAPRRPSAGRPPR